MKKVGINYRSKLGTELVEGERLELKIDRMTQNNEPIGDSAPLIYTPRKDEFKKVRADVDFLLLNSGAEVLA